MTDGPRKRRALTHVGGRTETEGDAAAAKALAHALDVDPSTDDEDDPSRAHAHGFHPYPARMHPTTAGRLVEAFAPPGGRVLDPFCGSGTVLVESLVHGRHATGTDLNPLAVRLARCKTKPRTPPELDNLVAQARACGEHADARRKGRAGATRRFPEEDVKLFEPHVLLELDSLRDKISAVHHDVRPDLLLVLSALLVKLSRKRGDTAESKTPKRTRARFATKLFVEKAEDLARRLREMHALLPAPAPEAAVEQDDATELGKVPPHTVTALITSPPYAATYDYVAHHALRMRWLGLDASPLARGELGSRSTYRRLTGRAAADTWANEVGRFLTAAARVLPPGGPLVMVVADSAVGGAALRAEQVVARVARGCGFAPLARASQPRPHFHGPTEAVFRTRARHEHALLLRRESPPAPRPPR